MIEYLINVFILVGCGFIGYTAVSIFADKNLRGK
jgi:hypothetical protein